MDYKAQLQNIKKLNEQLEQITKLQNQAFNNMTPEQYEAVKDSHKDANQMLEKFRKGDFKAVDELVNKYINPK